MAIHRRQLPIADPCDGFEPAPGSGVGTGGGFCTRCQKHVHDVSAMRESELRRFLTANAGTSVCLAYRVDERGVLKLRSEPRARVAAMAAIAAMAVLMAACAGYAGELETPDSQCFDAAGYQVVCDDSVANEMVTVPDGMGPVASRAPESEGCPIRPTAQPLDAGDGLVSEPTGVGSTGIGPADTSSEPHPDGSTVVVSGSGTTAKFRANFSIDPEESYFRGMVVVGQWEERDFVPTAQLLDEAKDRRSRRREQRRRWRRRRAAASL